MRFTNLIVTGSVCALAFSASAFAVESLPYFDVRLQANGHPAPYVEQAKAAAVRARQSAPLQVEAMQLQQEVRGLRVDEHEFFATPHYIGSTDQFLTAPAAGTPRILSRQFVASHTNLFNIDPSELDSARVERDVVSQHNGVTHLTLQQQIGGIDIYGCEILANVARNGQLINISSSMLTRPAGDFQMPAATISPLEAIRAAAANIGIKLTTELKAANAPEGVQKKQTWQNTPDFRSDEPITTELIYFPLTQNDIRPAWKMVIPEIGIGNTYEMMVDATNGQILRRWNRLHNATTEPITFRVYTSDDPAPGSPGLSTPSSTQFPFVQRSLVTINPTDVPYSTINVNGWINDGTSATDGNNVHSHLDLSNTNPSSTGAVAGSSYRTFDFPLEPASPPFDITVAPTDANARNAAVTQLFYLCNVYHDRLYQLGFTETSKNFQLNNFGRGGTQNDRVQADCQDGGGTNNANFSTSGGDGTSARMQMYIFTGPTPDRDGSLDSNIVFHEHSHGLSIRLSNGTVSGEQSGGMGEGWGDYFALSLNAQPSDDPHAVYPMGGYATYQLSGLTSNYYFGIRRFPYCTDMNKNPETYADVDPSQIFFPPSVPKSPIIAGAANEVHNVGEIWCNTLIECRGNLWDNEGFSGNNKMMQLVVDGLKLQVSNPNMLQARDGILQADTNDYGGADLCLLWKGFAKRGMGPLATSPSGSTATGVVESYSLATFSFPDGPLPTQLQPGVPVTFHVNVAGIVAAVQPTAATGQFFYSINGGPFSSVPMTVVGVNQYTATIPAANCFDQVQYYFTVDSCAGTLSSPGNAPTGVNTALVFTGSTNVANYNFETTPPWSVTTTATDGAWDPAPGIPVNCARGDPPADFDGSGKCWLTRNSNAAACNTDVDGGATTLTSEIFDVTSLANPLVQYARWYSNSFGANPHTQVFTVDISSNGGSSWVNLETVGPDTSSPHPEVDGGWYLKAYHISDFVPLTNQFRIRFSATDNIGAVVEAGVDAFKIYEVQCVPPCPAPTGDINNDTLVDGNDIAAFISALLNGPSFQQKCAGDFNSNNALDDGDVPGFVTVLLGP